LRIISRSERVYKNNEIQADCLGKFEVKDINEKERTLINLTQSKN